MRVIVHQVRAAGGPKTLRDLVHRERSHKVLRDFVHQARAPGGPKTLRDLVHRERRYKVLRVIVHQVRTAGRSKTHRDLVQKERRYKVLRVIVHQVRTAGRSKTHRDLVQKERRHKGLRVIVHQVLSRRFKSKPDDNKCVLKGNFFCGTVGAQRGGAANATRAARRRRRWNGSRMVVGAAPVGAEREDEAMRLKLVMKDREYRDALAKRIRRSRWNLYVIIEDNFRMEEDTLLVTDVGEGKLREGMVLLSSECRREVEGKGPYVLFKYAGVDELLTDLRLCAFLWTGKGDLRKGEERIVTVGAVERTDLGHRLAEQVALELGEGLEEPVLLLDLTYFYREGQPEESGNTFRKLVYYLQSGKSIPVEVFFRRERGNVFRVRMPRGMNELMKIPGAECLELIREMGRYFSAVVCSVGDCFSERNIELMKNSEWCIYMAEEDMREYFPKTSLVVPERAGEIRNAARLVQGILETP